MAATDDVDALLALGADAIVYSPLLPDEALVARMLASGANVVTPLGWVHPWRTDVHALEAACAEGGSTLHGTGIHPGGITERFPLMVSALSQRITHVRAEEFSDIRTYGAPDVIRHIMLFGTTPEEAATSPMVEFMGAGFRQSIDMLATELGFRLDERIAHEPRGGGGHGADRLTDRSDRARPRRRAALHLGGHRRRRAGGHGAHELVHGRARTSIPAGRSVRPVSASRSRSPAIRPAT